MDRETISLTLYFLDLLTLVSWLPGALYRLAVARWDHAIAVYAGAGQPDEAVNVAVNVFAQPDVVLRGHSDYVNTVAFSLAAGWESVVATGSGPWAGSHAQRRCWACAHADGADCGGDCAGGHGQTTGHAGCGAPSMARHTSTPTLCSDLTGPCTQWRGTPRMRARCARTRPKRSSLGSCTH